MTREFPPVSIATNNGRLREVTGFKFNTINVDLDLLSDVLEDMGEFEYEDRLPLSIHICAPWTAWRTEARAYAAVIANEDNQPIQRMVHVPLGHFFAAGLRKIEYFADLDRMNSDLVHELRHAVDFNDAPMMEQSIKEREEIVNKGRLRAQVANIGKYPLAATGVILYARGFIDQNIYEVMSGGAALVSASAANSMARRYVRRQFTSGILEERAYSLQSELWNEGKVPEIIKVE